MSAAHLAGSAPGSFAPKAEPARAAPLEPEQAQKLLDKQLLDLTRSAPDQKLLNRALQPVAVPEAAPKGTPPIQGSHETTVAQYQLCLEGASTLAKVRACKAGMESSSSVEGTNAGAPAGAAWSLSAEAIAAGAIAVAPAAAVEKPAALAPGGRFAAAAAAAKAKAAAAAAPPKRKCTSQWDGDCEKPDPNKPSCGPDWCSKWTTLAPECAGCNKVEEDKAKKAGAGGMNILDFQTQGVEEAKQAAAGGAGAAAYASAIAAHAAAEAAITT